MNPPVAAGVVLLLLAVRILAADPVFSGPQAGERTTSFQVLELTGPHADQERDPVAEHAGAPTALVFIHTLERSLAPLLRAIDQYGAERKDRLRTEIVFLAGDRLAAATRFKASANSLKLQGRVGLSLDGAEGPGNYGLNKDCLMTVLAARDNRVVTNFALVQPGIADAPAVLAALARACGDTNPPALETFTRRGMEMRRPGDAAPPATDKFPGAVPTDPDLNRLLRLFIRPTNDVATVDRLLRDVEARIGEDAGLRKQAVDGWTRVLHFGDRYGTEYSRQVGLAAKERWVAAAQPKPEPVKGGDSEGQRNLAARKLLPSGPGLAAAHPGDAGLGSVPGVIFADNFESGTLGQGWDEVGNKDGQVLSFVAPFGHASLGQRCLRVEAHLGRDTGGGLTKWFASADTLFVRFYTRFDGGCDYVHHFVTLRANRSLQGRDRWSGFGGAGLKPEGTERFSTAIEPWGNWGRNPPPGRWNFYSYWHEMEASRDGKYWGNSFNVPAAPVIPRDRWICVEFMLRHNTPGQGDGEQAFWIDGELQGHWQGIAWRKTEGLKANALTLESYITDRWTKNPTNVVLFDNLVIASRYVGP